MGDDSSLEVGKGGESNHGRKEVRFTNGYHRKQLR